MNEIPPDIYEQVHELALALTHATMAEDRVLCEVHFQALLDYHRELSAAGRLHPFVTETLADYTDDPGEAIRLYELAMGQSRKFPNEPIHTKQISLARRLIDTGDSERAEACLCEARADAVALQDPEAITEADSLLREIAWDE